MDKIIERIDIHGRIIWLPALLPDVAVAARSIIERTLAEATDWDSAAEIIDMRGGMLVLKVNHHGAQDYREWQLIVRDKSWLSGQIDRLAA